MAKQLPSVDTNADTFYAWIVKTNTIVQLCNTEVVTANNSANGATTTGTGYVIGKFGANTIVCSTLSGGNTISNGSLTIVSNTHFTANVNWFDNGVTIGANSNVVDQAAKVNVSNTSIDQVVDTFSSTAYRSAKYVISISDPTTPQFQATEILVLNDGVTTYTTEYATLTSNSQIATFRTDVANGAVRLLATPVVAPLQINISRTVLAT